MQIDENSEDAPSFIQSVHSPTPIYPSERELALKHATEESLNLHIYNNAIFLAERLQTCFPSMQNMYLVAQCYVRSGDLETAYRFLRAQYPFLISHNTSAAVEQAHVQQQQQAQESIADMRGAKIDVRVARWNLQYEYATVCARTQRWKEGEGLLNELSEHPLGDSAAMAAVFYWKGHCQYRMDKPGSLDLLENAVKRNPSLFTVYDMCNRHFMGPSLAAERLHLDQPPQGRVTSLTPALYDVILDNSIDCNFCFSTEQRILTNTINLPDEATVITKDYEGVRIYQVKEQVNDLETDNDDDLVVADRLHMYNKPASSEERDESLNDKNTVRSHQKRNKDMQLVKRFLRPYSYVNWSLYNYDHETVLEMVLSADFPEHGTSWVLSTAALACFHALKRHECAAFFRKLLTNEPWRLNDERLVHYSTCLWHLRDDSTLGSLARLMFETLRGNAIALAVCGNYYSLIKDKKSALLMLTKATELDRYLPVLHTLRGYEILSTDLSSAELSFMKAIRLDPRDYMALAGIATIKNQQGDIGIALHYFKQAVSINPIWLIIRMYASTFCKMEGKDNLKDGLNAALHLYDIVLQVQSKNLTCMHQRATVLMALGRWEEALHQLETLMVSGAGEEANVNISLGKCLAAIGDVQGAQAAYQKALDIDNGLNDTVKPLLETLERVFIQ